MSKSDQQSNNTTNRQVHFISGTQQMTPNLTNAMTCARRIGPRTWMAVLALVLSLLPSMAAAQVSLTVSNLTSTSATLTIANHESAWSYTPDQAATCGIVNSGTTADLSDLTPGTTYTYVAYSTTTCAPTSTAIAQETFTTLALTASAVTATTATLTIENHEEDWYYKYTAPTGGQCSSVQTGTTASLATLTPGTTYTFKAYSDSSCSTELATAAFLTKPGQTTGVTVAVLSAKLKVSWTAVTSATGYTVQWKSGNENYDTTRQATATGTSHTVTGLTNNTTYTLRVRATNGTGDGAWSADATGTPAAETLSVSDITQTTATLTLANYEGAWSYSHDNGATCGTVNSGTTTADLSDLAGGTTYTYVAYSTTTCGPTSADIARKTFTTIDLTASAVTATTATLTIENHEGDWYYKYTAPTGGQCSSVQTGTTVSSTASLATLTPGTNYTFKAYSDSSCSTELATVTFLTQPGQILTQPGQTLTLSAVKATTATVTISGHTGHWSYQVSSPGTPGTQCTAVLDGTTMVTLTGLTPGTTYTVQVYSDSNCTQKIGSQTFRTINEPPTFLRSRTIDAQSYVQHASVALTLPAATGGNPPLTYALAPGLPAGLTFDRATRKLAGTPTAPQGVTRYTYTVTDQDGKQATLTFTITVLAAVEKAIIEDGLAAQGRALLSSATGVIGARFQNPGASSLGGGGGCAGEAPRDEDRGATDAPPAPDGESDCLTGVLGTVAQAVLAMSGNGGGATDADSLGLADADATRPRGPRGANTALQPTGNWERLVWGRSFALPLQAASASESAWTLWGAGDLQGFQGTPRQGKYDGQVRSLYLGVDARWHEQWLAGAALSQSWGTMDYVTRAGKSEGRVKTTLMSVYPYVRGTLGTGLEVWALGGYGWGEAENTLRNAAGTRETSDLTMAMGATGARQPMTEWGGVQLAVVGGLGYLTLGTEAGGSLIADLDVAVNRARLAVEAAGAYGGLAPYVQVGGRYDGGAGQTGAGLETVAGVRYTSDRLEFEARGRWLAAHAADGYEEYGGLARLAVKPRADGTGWQMAVAPRWGAAQGAGLLGGGAALLDGGAMPGAGLGGMSAAGTARVLSVESQVGYGFGVFDGYGVLTPYGGFALTGEEARQYRLGGRLGVAEWLTVSLEGSAREAARQQPANQGVQLRLEGRF